MKNLLIAIALYVGFVSTSALAGPAPKVVICHIPPGNPDNYQTINVSENALSAHLAHGDLGGPCDATCDQICDDGNPCTIDHNGDCATNGCLTVPEPVDCSDGNLCTVDSCNAGTGCVNTAVNCIDPDLCTDNTCSASTGQCEESPKVCPDTFACSLLSGECDSQSGCQIDSDCSDGYTCIQNECVEGAGRDLRGPDGGQCDGPLVGFTSVVVLQTDDGIKVDVEFTNGPPSFSMGVFWVCTEVPGGCHGQACGFTNLGVISTNGSGQGAFSTILPGGNPYPGKYVHFDLVGTAVSGQVGYTSITHDEVFPSSAPAAAPASLRSESLAETGDPTDK